MNLNLEAMQREITKHLESRGIAIFHAFPRSGEASDAIYWDTERHPDVHEFLAAAEASGARIVSVHAREFTQDVLEDALGRLEEAALSRDERRSLEVQIKEMNSYTGATCQLELSFDNAQRTYIYEIYTEWFEDFNEALDRIDEARKKEDEEPFGGGYYSRN